MCEEYYINTVKVKAYCIALCRFRCGNHMLLREHGRHLNLAREERLCPLCVIPVVESEYHFCLECPFYQDLRSTLIPHFYYVNPSENKLASLFRTQSSTVINSLAKYIFLSMKKRMRYFSV